jgi:hypothetical protein
MSWSNRTSCGQHRLRVTCLRRGRLSPLMPCPASFPSPKRHRMVPGRCNRSQQARRSRPLRHVARRESSRSKKSHEIFRRRHRCRKRRLAHSVRHWRRWPKISQPVQSRRCCRATVRLDRFGRSQMNNVRRRALSRACPRRRPTRRRHPRSIRISPRWRNGSKRLCANPNPPKRAKPQPFHRLHRHRRLRRLSLRHRRHPSSLPQWLRKPLNRPLRQRQARRRHCRGPRAQPKQDLPVLPPKQRKARQSTIPSNKRWPVC